jgi:uncharacterized RDD family membrane protein YckC
MSTLEWLPRPNAAEPCPLCGRRQGIAVLYDDLACQTCRWTFAGLRTSAFLVDYFMMLLIASGFEWLGRAPATPLLSGVDLGLAMLLLFPLKDGLGGASPGKRLVGLRVIDAKTYQPIGFGASFKRNVLALILWPLIMLELPAGFRLGDRWANTKVIWRKHAYRRPFCEPGRYCAGCGYDLTGNISGRCPECGLPIPEDARHLLSIPSGDLPRKGYTAALPSTLDRPA